MLQKYAELLVDYSLAVQKGQRVLVRSTTLAEPLLKEVYACLLKRGAHVEHMLSFEDQDRLFYDNASDDQLASVSQFYTYAVENFDAVMSLMAPHNLKSTASVPQEKKRVLQEAMLPVRNTFMTRSSKKELNWILAVYPTQSAAQEAGMSLPEFREFVYEACRLNLEDPVQAWKNVSKAQEKIVERLNNTKIIRYVGLKTDVSFSVEGRTWINSNGRHNMPCGEVFSGPVEDSVNGHVYFDVPTVYDGADVQGVYLEIKDGEIQSWKADVGQSVLDRVFSVDGAKYFGEVAIGTNYGITKPIKNILFDEKIGGTIHMAVGASYPETGGTNKSAVHWDMIKYMSDGGQIYADDVLIYENGKFIIDEAADLYR